MDTSCDGMTSFSTNLLMTAESKSAMAVTQMMASCTPPELQGGQLLSGLASGDGRKRAISYSAFELCDDDIITEEDANSEDCSQLLGEKKRRLSMEQVRTLERNFELGNRLEPERKLKLAKELGLHPRQIAIWFQNRRARWKTKQLEKDFVVLKHDYESFKADYHSLQEENKKLQAEIERLSSIFHKEKVKVNVNAVQIGFTANKENERCFSSSCIKTGSSSVNLIHLDRSHTVEALHPEGIKSEVHANKYYYIDQQAGATCHRIMSKAEDTVREDSGFYIMEEQGNCSWWDHWSQSFQ